MKSIYDLILFDLDGTLTNSEPGIFSSVKKALASMNFPIPDDQTLRRFIGPPLWYSFVTFCGMTGEQAEQAVDHYRETYNVTGAFLNLPYPHIVELLDKLKSTGVKLAVATSKPDNIAGPVLDYFHLTPYFEFIAAPDEKEHSSNKDALILSAVNACNVPKDRTVMIGDTHFDVIGAREAGVDFIGVLYGFGTQAEMEQEGGKVFARDIAELEELLIPNG
jgi:phosphoglycolate phosphatase